MSLFNDILTKVKQSPTYQNSIAQGEMYQFMLGLNCSECVCLDCEYKEKDVFNKCPNCGSKKILVNL